MKLIRPKIYTTKHSLSKLVGGIVQEGCKGDIVEPSELQDGPVVSYGILRGCGKIISQAREIKRDFYHIDHAYFCRIDWNKELDKQKNFLRISKNRLSAISPLLSNKQVDPSRLNFIIKNQLFNKVRPFNNSGNNIIVCNVTEFFAENHPYLKVNYKTWAYSVVEELRKYTDRPIIVKNKSSGNIYEDLLNAYAIVVHSSNAALDALCMGITPIILGESITEGIGPSLREIEKISTYSRSEWEDKRYNILAECANNQWSLEELTQYDTWEKLGCVPEWIE